MDDNQHCYKETGAPGRLEKVLTNPKQWQLFHFHQAGLKPCTSHSDGSQQAVRGNTLDHQATGAASNNYHGDNCFKSCTGVPWEILNVGEDICLLQSTFPVCMYHLQIMSRLVRAWCPGIVLTHSCSDLNSNTVVWIL